MAKKEINWNNKDWNSKVLSNGFTGDSFVNVRRNWRNDGQLDVRISLFSGGNTGQSFEKIELPTKLKNIEKQLVAAYQNKRIHTAEIIHQSEKAMLDDMKEELTDFIRPLMVSLDTVLEQGIKEIISKY